MARFPLKEAEIVALAQEVITGLTNNVAVYPAPPVTPAELTTLLNNYIAARNAAVAAVAAAEAATASKDTMLGHLEDDLKSELRYAENTVNFDDAKLKLIGWGGKKSPTPLAMPGQTRMLEATRQGEGWIYLDWKAPVVVSRIFRTFFRDSPLIGLFPLGCPPRGAASYRTSTGLLLAQSLFL